MKFYIYFRFTYFSFGLLQKYYIKRQFCLAIVEGCLDVCTGKSMNILHGNAVTNMDS